MTAASKSLTIGVLADGTHAERRVALDPASAARLIKAGWSVLVEKGAGETAHFADDAYVSAGAEVVTRAALLKAGDVLPVLRLPDAATIKGLRSGQMLIGLIEPLNNLDVISGLASRGVTAVALDLLPRTLSRAQSMDALSSQSSAAGYRAGIVAAAAFTRYLPMMVTAAGAATPAKVIVIGTGVAGLQAIATLKRLGAVVTGYDVREASRGEVESLGARFFTSSVAAGAGDGGYARAMTADERATQQKELETALVGFDIIITTARVPGHTPPVLVSKETLASLKPGTVCVDLGASEHGGNVVGSQDGETITTNGDVIIIGGGNLASDLPTSSSEMYGRNIMAALGSLAPDAVLAIDRTDEVHAAIVVTTDGDVINAAVREALKLDPLPTPATPEKVTAD
jgi:H+-translocating NAD(P) transhydrogenase subunit alpha